MPDLVRYTDELIDVGKNARNVLTARVEELGKDFPGYIRWLCDWIYGSHHDAMQDVGWMQRYRSGLGADASTRQRGAGAGRERRRIYAGDNGIFTALQTAFARGLTMRARPAFLPTVNTDDGLFASDLLNRVMDEYIRALRFDYHQAMGMLASGGFGTSVYEFDFEPMKEMHGIVNGRLDFKLRDPLSFLWDHDAISVGTAKWWIYLDIVPKSYIYAYYQPGTSFSKDDARGLPDVTQDEYNEFTLIGNKDRKDDRIPRCLRKRAFYRHEDGRIETWHCAGNWLMRRKQDPLGLRMIPALRMAAHKIPSWTFWDMGDTAAQVELQAINDLGITLLLGYLMMHSKPTLFVRQGVLFKDGKPIDPSDIGSVLGNIIETTEVDPRRAAAWTQLAELAPAVMYGLGFIFNRRQDVGGIHDIARGRSRAGDSGRKVIALSEEMDRAMESRMFGLGEFNRKWARLWVGLMVNFGDPDAVHPTIAPGREDQEEQQQLPWGRNPIEALRMWHARRERRKLRGTWGEVLEMLDIEPNTDEAREWARHVPIEIGQVPLSETRRSKELNELISILAVLGGTAGDPNLKWAQDTLVELLNSPTARRNYEANEARKSYEGGIIGNLQNTIAQLAEQLQVDPAPLIEEAMGGGPARGGGFGGPVAGGIR